MKACINTISKANIVRISVTSSRRILGFDAFVREKFSVSFILIKQLEQRVLPPDIRKLMVGRKMETSGRMFWGEDVDMVINNVGLLRVWW